MMLIFICQTHCEHLMNNKMNNFGFLVLFGLLAIGHAKPEAGYSYQGPQILPQPSNLPQLNQFNGQSLQRLTLNQGPSLQQSQPLQLSLNEGQQSASFQQSQPSQDYLPQLNQPREHAGYSYQQPQLQVNVQPQPQLNVQPQPQFNVQQQPQFNVQPQQPQFNVQVQQPQPQLVQLPKPQLRDQGYSYQQPQLNVQPQFNVQPAQPQFNVQLQQPQPQFNVQLPQPQAQLNLQVPVPQGNLNNFQSSLQQSLPQIQFQPQVNFNQAEQSSSFQQRNPQPSFQNALPQDNGGQNLLESSQSSQQELLGGVGQSLVTKHISIHIAPEDPQEVAQLQSHPLPARKNYKIIFIKAPSVGLSRSQIIAQQAAQVQEKTLVYVLVNKPHESELVLPHVAPAPVSKPEVYFIKYKSRSNGNGPSLADDAGSLGGSTGPGASLPIVEDVARVPVNSGESTSSLFSGGLPGPRGPSPQYGVPGYQKRSTQK